MPGNDYLSALREQMRQQGVDAVFLSSADPHQSDGVAAHWRVMQWFTGFTGTTGCCVVTHTKAAFWSDGRYEAQMHQELDVSIFELYNTSHQGTLLWTDWLIQHFSSHSLSAQQNCKAGCTYEDPPENAVLSLDGEVISIADYRKYETLFYSAGIRIRHNKNLPGELWTNRPLIPTAAIWELDLCLAGEGRKEKICKVRTLLKQKEADFYLGAGLDDIAWLTNLRGNDHPLYPVFHAYTVITATKVWLCTDEKKLSTQLKNDLKNDGVFVVCRTQIFDILATLEGGTLLIDPYKTSMQLYSSISSAVRIVEMLDIITTIKCRKNAVEQENIRKSNVKESVAIVRFIRHINRRLEQGPVTEYELVQELEQFRKMDVDYIMPANMAIIAYGSNAALPHYRPTKEEHALVNREGMLLFDICAHYRTGTTDITRVIPVGPCSKEMCTDYTLALKSHIAVAAQHFIHGTTGDILDGISKAVQWNHLQTFGHGTGHGMGYLTYVHEGPAKIITEFAPLFPYAKQFPLDTGMLFSDEPGVYKPGRYGIRLENDLLVQESCNNEFGRFLKFETVTFCPFERDLILDNLMTADEISWLNAYHKKTFETLFGYLSTDDCAWLQEKTAPINERS